MTTFLKGMGLALNPNKTKVVRLDEGFDFLGFHIQQFNRPDGTRKLLYFGPERKRVDRFLTQTREILRHKLMEPAQEIVQWLNRRMIGWANYYKWSMASKMFAYADHQLFWMLWAWAKQKHYRQSAHWRKDRYWKTVGKRHWVFSSEKNELLSMSKLTTDWTKYIKVRLLANPFDCSMKAYWNGRKITYLNDLQTSIEQF